MKINTKILAAIILTQATAATTTAPKLLDFPIQHCTTNGGCTTENTKLTLDANWRWYYHPSNYQNCFDNGYTCTNDQDCADCVLTGDVDYAAYGIGTSGDEVTLKFKAQNGGIGSRVYVVDADGEQYKLFDLLNKEISMDVDIAALGCGLNGAVYFSEMSADGGASKGSQGAAYGTGYCDAQCPSDLHQVDGKVNFENKHQCCNEMDIWEANSISNALTPHTCLMPDGSEMVGPADCTGTDCGEGAERYQSICDKDGCDLNPYRLRNTEFYGPGKQVDTTKPFTVTTRFFTDFAGDLTEIRRTYYQKNDLGETVEISSPSFYINGNEYDSITDAMCTDAEAPQPLGFASESTFMAKGGLTGMGNSFERGMVLVLSIWDDLTSDMLWLDGTAESMGLSDDFYGATRGPCTTGVDRNSAAAQSATVKYSNIRYGDLYSTTPLVGETTPVATNAPTNPVTDAPEESVPEVVTSAPQVPEVTSSPTSAPLVPVVTTPPNSGSGSESCGFEPTARCWGTGCTVQVAVADWEPSQLIQMTVASGVQIPNMWNAEVVERDGPIVTVRLASYNSDSFGFNQAGSDEVPVFSCNGVSSSATTSTPTSTDTSGAGSSDSTPTSDSSSACGFTAGENCWNSGCTIQVEVGDFDKSQTFSVVVPNSASIPNMWNANILSEATESDGKVFTVQLAGYNPSSFGFNMNGSDKAPIFRC